MDHFTIFQYAKVDLDYKKIINFFITKDELKYELSTITNERDESFRLFESILLLFYKMWFIALKLSLIPKQKTLEDNETLPFQLLLTNKIMDETNFTIYVKKQLTIQQKQIISDISTAINNHTTNEDELEFHYKEDAQNDADAEDDNEDKVQNSPKIQVNEKKRSELVSFVLEKICIDCSSLMPLFLDINNNLEINIDKFCNLNEWKKAFTTFPTMLREMIDIHCELMYLQAQHNRITPPPASIHYNNEEGIQRLEFLVSEKPELIFKSTDLTGYTIFHWICEKGNVQLVKQMIEYSIQENVKVEKELESPESWKPIYLHQYLFVVVSEDENTMNQFFHKKNKLKKILSFKIDINATVSRTKKTALQVAIEKSFEKSVEFLISKGASVKRLPHGYSSAIHTAVLQNYNHLSNNPDSNNETHPIRNDGDDNADDKGAHLNSELQTTKVSRKDIEILKLLLRQPDCDLNVIDCNNRTPLHLAIKQHNIEAVCVLLQNHANVNIPDGKGNTPLHIAVKMQSLEIVRRLIKLKADPKILNIVGVTPLALAEEMYQSNRSNILYQIIEMLHNSWNLTKPRDRAKISSFLTTQRKKNPFLNS